MPQGEAITPPGLDFAFEIRARTAAVLSGGPGKLGERLHIPIVGGEVAGPRLTGSILPGGSDWALLRPDGNAMISAHYTIAASDGTPIYVRNQGLRVASPEVFARLRSAQPVDPSEYYFRSVIDFDVPDGPHEWLMNAVFVADCARLTEFVRIRVFQVL